MRDNKVQSVTRAIQLLALIADHKTGITIGQLAERTGLHKSTVSRLVMTLEAAGVLQRPESRSTLQIAPQFAQRLATHTQPTTLRRIARPFLEELSRHFGEASGLVVPEHDQAVYVDQVSPNNAIQVRDWIGSRFPLHTISPGKLFLAHRSPAEQDRYLSLPLAAYTPNTTTDPDQLRQSFREIKESGVSWIHAEFADGLCGVAAPIFDHTDEVIASLVVFAPSFRFPDSQKVEAINLMMIDFAQRCSAEVQTQLTSPR